MKIAVPATGPEAIAAVDDRFGRAGFFVVYDTDTSAWENLVNSAGPQSAQGAGIQSAELLVRHGIGAVVTPHCGPKAFCVLRAAGIAVHLGIHKTVQEAVDAFLAGQLPAASDADLAGHW